MTANDSELLRQYVREQSEAAFAELVRRHLRLVYSAALRRVNGERAAAEDAAQAVFTDLARKAPRLLRHSSLTGWLYTSTRFQTAKIRREAHRRQAREHAAHAMNEILRRDSPDHDWAALRPLLDEAMDQLAPGEREVVLWRFFEQRPFADIGQRLGLRENAARMRVERAVDRLRAELAKRGITSSGVALAAALAAHGTEPEPTGLAERITRASVAAGAAGGLAWLFVSARARLLAGAAGLVTVGAILFSMRPGGSGAAHGLAAQESREANSQSASQPAAPGAGLDKSDEMKPDNLPIPEPSVFRLSLVAAQDARPVVDGEVALSLDSASGSETRTLRPDANGTVSFEMPSNIVGLRLVTQIEGFADKRLAWRQDRGETIPRSYVLKLTPGVKLGGCVVDGQGQPLSGADVTTGLEEPPNSPRPEAYVAGFRVKTDENGRWQACRVAPELVRDLVLFVGHADLPGTWLHVGTEPDAEEQLRAGTYTFHMAAVTNVSGLVVDPEGNPVSGASVRVGGLHEVGSHGCRSGPDGTFTLPDSKLGNLVLTGEAKGFAPTSIRVCVDTNSEPVRLVLSRGQVLDVRVLDRGGHPVTGATVDVEPDLEWRGADGSMQAQTFSLHGQTDGDGLARFPAVPDNPLWVGVGAAGFIRQDGIKARAGGPELAVTLLANLVVSGTVRDGATGELMPKFRIVAGKPGPNGPEFSDLDRFVLNFGGGEFRHAFDEAVTIGENQGYLLRFEADGYAPVVSRLIAPDEGSAQIDVSLLPSSTRRVSVLNPDGTPAAYTDAALLEDRTGTHCCLGLTPGGLAHYQGNGVRQTDAQGVLSLAADTEPHRIVLANRAGYLETNLDQVADGGSVQLQPWGQIEGSLPESDRSRSGLEVWIEFARNALNVGVMTGMAFNVKPDATGHFLLPRVPPGKIQVSVGAQQAVSDDRWVWNASHWTFVEVQPGQMTEVTFGGGGDLTSRPK
jgi:RNA polymerase sigma factor (sigma-70 family)